MKVLVIGLGVSGRSAVDLLSAGGDTVVAYDADPESGVGVAVDELRTGAWDARFLEGMDLVVTSPGVPETSQVIGDALASGLPIWSELELGYRHHEGTPLVAITGTNGKTTVTEMTAAMLVASGIDASPLGNIGDPISSAGRHEVLVLEASSFQLRFIDGFRPDVGVLVNFAPDHLDWHPDVDAYGAAKSRLFENMLPESPLVYDADDAGASGLVTSAAPHKIGLSGIASHDQAGSPVKTIELAGTTVDVAELTRRDPVMLVDLSLAAEAASALGATRSGIVTAARAYTPGRHRREVVATFGGVMYIDDSKATNPHAALAAIGSYSSVVLIAGGKAKGLDIKPLATARSVRHLVAIGEGASDLVSARPDAVVARTMSEAVDDAMDLAVPGDVVLLSPGCASFDMFDSYGHRGDAFAAAVHSKVGA